MIPNGIAVKYLEGIISVKKSLYISQPYIV